MGRSGANPVPGGARAGGFGSLEEIEEIVVRDRKHLSERRGDPDYPR